MSTEILTCINFSEVNTFTLSDMCILSASYRAPEIEASAAVSSAVAALSSSSSSSDKRVDWAMSDMYSVGQSNLVVYLFVSFISVTAIYLLFVIRCNIFKIYANQPMK